MGADVAAEEPFGPYLVYERLGVGGMATVHRALERGIEGFERIVALKRLLPHLAADASFIKSFVREAKLASLLNHVNIVQIFELGRVGTQYFISMEYIDGRDIRRILRHARKVSGPPPIHVTVGLLLQLCDALDYAHHKADDDGVPMGLVHRDVSPSNVLVTSSGQVKIIDFGIAKAQSSQLRTQTGRVKGKLAYMAPEALAGKDLDARSDLFAAGVIAHELLTARPLFASKNEYQTLMKVQRGDVMPPSTFNQGCPAELDAIVLRALARDPDDRFRHAGELRDELHAMRKQYSLQSSVRDVAAWLEWAFGLEAPAGFAGNTSDQPNTDLDARAHRHRMSRARRPEDDEVVELAWGGHDEHGSGEPIVLDDVPDVSDKHLQHASALGAEVRVDLDDLADDIPTPLPSHGKPTVDLTPPRTRTPLLRPRPGTRRKSPTGAPRSGSQVMASEPAPAGDDGVTTIDGQVSPELRAAIVPSRVRTITIPPRAVPSSSAPPRSIAAAALPPRIAPLRDEPSRPVPVAVGSSRSGAVAAERSRRIAAVEPPPEAGRDTLLDLSATERRPTFRIEDLGLAADTMPSMPAMPAAQTSVSVVRFREPTSPPPMAVVEPLRPAAMAAAPPTAAADAPPKPEPPPRDAPPPAVTTSTRRQRLITPATALFAEPEPDAGATVVSLTAPDFDRASHGTMPDLPPVSRRRLALGRAVLVVICLAVICAATTVAALYLTSDDRGTDTPRTTPPAAPIKTGNVQFEVVPADAAITIGGKPVHTGTPWSVELDPGTYQIEIDRDGYMGWLTSLELVAGQSQILRIPLEPLGAAVAAEATLIVDSTPAGLDVAIDGISVGKTPDKRMIAAGRHSIALRADGADVWHRDIDAHASAVYDFRPTIAAPGSTAPAAAAPASGSAAGAAPGAGGAAPGVAGTAPGTATGTAPGTATGPPAASAAPSAARPAVSREPSAAVRGDPSSATAVAAPGETAPAAAPAPPTAHPVAPVLPSGAAAEPPAAAAAPASAPTALPITASPPPASPAPALPPPRAP